ncbi:MAG: phosphatidate cytidylyltransferase [Candidatus Cloacimonadaceae bacterium]|nr:phosphatidate cytidylyltransferase [Candidatus Cloacimonadaceae bacterium]
MTELNKRVGVSLFFIPMLLAALFYGGVPLIAMFFLVTLLGGMEFITMLRNPGIRISWIWVIAYCGLYLAMIITRSMDIVLLWAVFFLAMLDGLVSWAKDKSLKRVFAIIFGAVYLGMIPAMIARIGLDYSGEKILFALIIMIWIVDSVAYFVGMRFGKHRNMTEVSPRKSLEGFLAGVFAPMVIVIILYYSGFALISLTKMFLIAFAAGIIGQLGDLAESMLKRFCDVKDSSKLIPGHGGILDRTDSILLAGSFLYCALTVL